jgi:hypothetical protein
MKFSNNIKSKYLILNIKFKKIQRKYSLNEIKTILIEWVEESLLYNYNRELNWNIGIYIPSNFYLLDTDDNYNSTMLNKNKLLESLLVKVFIYIDNTYYPEMDENLLYNNRIYNTEIFNEIHPDDIIEHFNVNNDLLLINDETILESLSISGMEYYEFYNILNSILLGDLFNIDNLDNIIFINLKNIKLNNNYKLIQPIEQRIHFINNLLYNS